MRLRRISNKIRQSYQEKAVYSYHIQGHAELRLGNLADAALSLVDYTTSARGTNQESSIPNALYLMRSAQSLARQRPDYNDLRDRWERCLAARERLTSQKLKEERKALGI